MKITSTGWALKGKKMTMKKAPKRLTEIERLNNSRGADYDRARNKLIDTREMRRQLKAQGY